MVILFTQVPVTLARFGVDRPALGSIGRLANFRCCRQLAPTPKETAGAVLIDCTTVRTMIYKMVSYQI